MRFEGSLSVASIINYLAQMVTVWVGVLDGRRMRHVFVLGLFNDAVCVCVLVLAMCCLVRRQWLIGCLLYSFSVSIKMNILLYAPGLAVLLLHYTGPRRTAGYIAACGILQIAIAWPFLASHPYEYLAGAFNLGRQFDQHWSANFHFLPRNIFASKAFAAGLLTVTIVCWLWMRAKACGLPRAPIEGMRRIVLHGVPCTVEPVVDEQRHLHVGRHPQSPFRGPVVFVRTDNAKALEKIVSASSITDLIERHVALVMCASNIVGVIFARSLHYQFFAWYWHCVLLHAVSSRVPGVLWPLWGYWIMFAWEIHPPADWSSRAITLSHALLLCSLLLGWRVNIQGFVQGAGDFLFYTRPKTVKQA
jgi:alpha-1,3-mannosyltransferase